MNAGRLYKYTEPSSGTFRLFIEGRGAGHVDPFVDNEYNDKYLINGRNGCFIQIKAGVGSTGTVGSDGYVDVSVATLEGLETMGFTGHWSLDHDPYPINDTGNGDWPWVKIVDFPFPAHFKESDNSGEGLILTMAEPEFYVTGLDTTLFQDGFAVGILFDLTYNGMTAGKYVTLCEKELTVNYEGTAHTIPSGTVVKHAQIGDFDHRSISDLGGDYIFQMMGFQVYWSKHDPTNLYFSMGYNPDANNPTEGLFIIAEVRGGNRYSTSADPRVHVIAPAIAPKPETLVVVPSLP